MFVSVENILKFNSRFASIKQHLSILKRKKKLVREIPSKQISINPDRDNYISHIMWMDSWSIIA